IKGMAQGKHRYYSLYSAYVAGALEALNIVASNSRDEFIPGTPSRLMLARTCYDHIAGKLGVSLYSSFTARGWFSIGRVQNATACELSASGRKAFAAFGINLEEAYQLRRRFAYECLDWSERRPHLGGALAAFPFALLVETH